MKYVPSLPPSTNVATDRWATNVAPKVKPVKPVQERTLPPLVTHPQHAQHETPPGFIEKAEKRHEKPFQERRMCCRRVAHQPILEELRSWVERRRNRQRGDDMTDHIDEKV